MNKNQIRKMQFKILLTGLALLFATSINVIQTGSPYWYQRHIFMVLFSCWETVEQNQSLAEGMWYDDIRAVCGCVVDAIRHSMFHETREWFS